MQSIFDFPNADNCRCTIIGYMRSLSLMEIEVNCGKTNVGLNTFYITFEGVEYFDCPVTWQGGGFRIMPSADCLDLLHQLGRYEGIADDYLRQRFQLVTAYVTNPPGSNLQIKILSANSIVSSSPSPYFSRISG
ncbi:MAG: hypothetical protein H6672_23165 [Anaerolineaceae bacterium]|nr:hypothetical protein [Anaerolineaceae bacterium]